MTAVTAPVRPPGRRPARPRRRGIWIAVAVLTAVAAVVPIGIRSWVWLSYRTSTSRATYAAGTITSVDIDAGPGAARVVAVPGNRITVGQTLHWAFSRPRVEQTRTGGTLRIAVVCHVHHSPLATDQCGAVLRVSVPARVAVRAASVEGEITVRGVTGGVHAETAVGLVRLDGVAGPVWARSTAGEIDAHGLRSPRVYAASSAGAVRLGFAAAPQQVTASADSGSVNVLVPPGTRYRVGGSTQWGTRRIDPALVDAHAPRSIDATTSAGAVTVRYAGTG